MSGFMKSVSAAAVAAILFGAGQSRASTVAPVATTITSGTNVDGWRITFPVGIGLVSDGGSALTLEKFAAFDSLEGLAITFTQVAANASPTITLADEAITNVSGTDFHGFQFLLVNELPSNTSGASFSGQSFNLTDPADNKFTSQTVTPGSINFHGTLANYDTADLGFGAGGGGVVIDANPSAQGQIGSVFQLKEIPVAAVPLPEASWMGLSGLVGLGILAHGKKLKKVLA